MDQIAIISDIHGNMPALEAVLADIRTRKIAGIFCLGDLVGKGPDSDQAVDVCREVCEAIVRGNWDDVMLRPQEKDIYTWHQRRLGPERLAYLAALPNQIEFVMSGRNVRLFHASQVSVYHRVHMFGSYEQHLAMFENTEFTGDGPAPQVVGYGDIHAAYVHSFQGRVLFNAGSVGNPLDEPTAAYTLLTGTYGCDEPGRLEIQIVRVPYDIERAIADATRAGSPEPAEYADELRTAQYRGLKRLLANKQG